MALQLIIGVNVIAALATFSTSLTGFGYALVGCPLLLLLLPAKVVVPAILLSSMLLSAILIVGAYREFNLRRIGTFLLGALPGSVLGVQVLASSTDETMTRVIGSITVVAAVGLWAKPRRPLAREGTFAALAGGLSGILGGASALSGPPVVLYGLNQNWDHRLLRADMIGYFSILHASILVMFGHQDLLLDETLELAVWMLPGIVIGYGAAQAISGRINQSRFRTLSLGIVTFGGLVALCWS